LIKRPLLLWAVSYIIGILWGLYFKKISIVLLIVCIIYVCINKYLKLTFRMLIIIIVFLLLGLFNVLYKNYEFTRIYTNFDNKNIHIIATIISNKEEKQYKDVYTIKIDEIINSSDKIKFNNLKLLLYVNKKNNNLEYGDKISLKAEFIVADSKRNYKGFDYRNYLKSKGIYGIVKCDFSNIDILEKDNVNYILKISNIIKTKIINNIRNIFPEDVSGILIGMLIGDTTYIHDYTENNFRNSSLTHLLSVSGANMVYIMLAITYIFKKIKIRRKIANIFTILIIIFFMIVTGLSVSVIRAGIMGIILIISKMFYRRLDIYTSIGISLILILLYNPFSIFDIGLQLSFLGTIRNCVDTS